MNSPNPKNDVRWQAEPSLKALARYAAVGWITQRMQDEPPEVTPLSTVIHAAAERDWNGFRFSTSSLERYYYHYQHFGFAGLVEKPRADQGKTRKLAVELAEQLLAARRAQPLMPITVLLDLLREKGVDVLAQASLSSVHRFLRQHGLDRHTLRQIGPEAGPQKAFEMPAVNMLWMTDLMYGPVFRDAQDRIVKTRLFALLDDHSRLCPAAEYFASEALDCFLAVLRQAVLRRGLPEKLYTDCGKIYTGRQLGVICANLGIKLLHAQPYHAWSKGKIERFFGSVQTSFQSRLLAEPVRALEDLNRRFWVWLEEKYHHTVHRATGQTPAERFAAGVAAIRPAPSAEELSRLFMARVRRRVRRDGCVSVAAQLFEVPLCLRGLEIEIRHAIPLAGPIEAWYQGRLVGSGRPLNKQQNATQYKRRTS